MLAMCLNVCQKHLEENNMSNPRLATGGAKMVNRVACPDVAHFLSDREYVDSHLAKR